MRESLVELALLLRATSRSKFLVAALASPDISPLQNPPGGRDPNRRAFLVGQRELLRAVEPGKTRLSLLRVLIAVHPSRALQSAQIRKKGRG